MSLLIGIALLALSGLVVRLQPSLPSDLRPASGIVLAALLSGFLWLLLWSVWMAM